MSNKKPIAIAAFVLIGATALFLSQQNQDDDSAKQQPAQQNQTAAMPKPTPSETITMEGAPLPPKEESVDVIEDMTSSHDLSLIAERHEEVLQYPAYSTPITDKNSPYLDWNHFEEVPVPVLNGEAKAALSLDKYRHFYPDKIDVRLKLSANYVTASLDIIDVESQQTLTTLPVQENGWQITPEANWPQELRLVARISFEQGEDVISADLRLYHSVASIINVDQASSNNSDMVIPITVQVDRAGIYRVRGSLYQSSGSAVASLVQKKQLAEGEQTVELKAFHNVLPNGRTEYELRDIMIERMSGFPGEKAQYGQSEAESYPIGSFDSNTLSDEPYEMSGKEKQQLEFLHQAAN
ncbi:hypothetical protein [Vibrio owensii]|uniref:hypothetical protein n=1 Tax=Vibrio owensii TaxID=696485 RepID=UPI0005F068CD|nr:hypothetical protein [Vibrio owensii]